MLILDTNVLSEVLRPIPEPAVLEWLEAQPRSQLFTTAITRAEILYGVALLAKSPRRQKLPEALLAIFDVDLADKILPFDATAADLYADIAAKRKAVGKPISQLDAMIAAISRTHQARLATRNTKDFSHCDIGLIDPWNPG